MCSLYEEDLEAKTNEQTQTDIDKTGITIRALRTPGGKSDDSQLCVCVTYNELWYKNGEKDHRLTNTMSKDQVEK